MSSIEKLIKDLLLNPFDFANTLNQKQLEDIILFTKEKYFNEEEIINDAIYDMLIEFLQFKFPKSKVLKNVGASAKDINKVSLPYHMGSMDKIKFPSNKLKNFKEEFKSPYIWTEKLDGMSALLVYDYNKEIKLYKRGNEKEGNDITKILKYIPNVLNYKSMEEICKKNNLKGEKNLIALRGELIMSKATFEKSWKNKMKNARNAVGGLINSKNINPKLAGDTTFVIYEIVDPFLNMGQQLDLISKMKFNKVHHKFSDELNYDILSKYLKKRRSASKYMIDGIIVTNNDNHKRNTKGNPTYAFAFKDILEDQIAKTKVLEIEWNISKDGYVKPTLKVTAVDIGGVTIKRVSAANAKFIKDNKIGKGTEIELIRSGDVIPYINKVLKPSEKPDLPNNPDSWHWTESGVDIVLNDSLLNSKERNIKHIYYFFSSLETKGMGEKIVEKFYNSGLNTIEKILNASKADILRVEGFKDKSAENLLKAIGKSLVDIPLAKLFKAANLLGRGIGFEKSKTVLDRYPNLIKEYSKWSKQEFIDKIKDIEGWDTKTAKLFVNNFPKFMEFYDKIKKFVVIKSKKKTGTKLENKIFVFSKFRDENLEEKIENNGGKINNSVSKNTDYLVIKEKVNMDEQSGKIKKALELNVKIITKIELINLLN